MSSIPTPSSHIPTGPARHGPIISVYGASILAHASMWLELRALWTEVRFTSRWHHMAKDETEKPSPMSPGGFATIWQIDHQDVLAAQVTLVYAEESDILRGALVEAGIAIGLGRRVIACGKNAGFGTWQHHGLVHRCDTLLQARYILGNIAKIGSAAAGTEH